MRTNLLDAGGYLQVDEYASPDLCGTWVSAVLENRQRWLKRLSGYTYGRAWYLDLESGLLDRYHARASDANALLASTLPGFVEHLARFSEYLVGPNGETNLPTRARRQNLGPYWCDAGIHILGGDANHPYAGGAPHADYEGLSPYVPALFDENTRAYSAILSLATPAWGAGLAVWTDRRYTADKSPSRTDCRQPPVTLEYRVGTMTAIDSFLYHQIRKGGYSESSPWRIVGIIHFLYRPDPYPHWEHWF